LNAAKSLMHVMYVQEAVQKIVNDVNESNL